MRCESRCKSFVTPVKYHDDVAGSPIMSLAPPSELAGVKVYNLSSVGKALPAWVTERRKNASVNSKKRRGRVQDERIEIIQDLFFPTTSGRVKISRDGSTMMATGGYPPMVRAYELRELSLKFTRNFESDVVQFQMLSPDWKKAVFLLADRSIEFHSQFGKHHVTRIPHHGRAMAYQRETCDLLLGGVGGELYRLNLERGSFLAPLQTGASGLNVLAVNPTHGMLVVGTQDGHVQCWDPRQRLPLGTCSPFDAPEIARAAAATHGLIDPGAPEGERELLPAPREVTALRFDARGLQLAVGTSTGHVALYDLRRASPLRIKDHQYGLPIVDIKYHSMTGHVVSSDAKSIKIWERESGKTYTSIEPAADVNDVALYPDSGMIFAALETERLGAYFVPSLGPAPRWCHFLDNITEEMEEAPTSQGLYDDYKFVTREEIEKLGLAALLGTTTLRPYMHGFFVDAKLHAKAVSLSQPFAYEQWRKQRLEEKLAAKTAGRIAPVLKPKVKVNAELAEDLRAPAKKRSFGSKGDESEVPKGALLDDSRFASLFTNPDFAISRDSEEYQALHPHAKELNDARASRLKAARAEESADGEDDDEAREEEEDQEDQEDQEEDQEEDEEGYGEEEDELSALRSSAKVGGKRGRDGHSKAAARQPGKHEARGARGGGGSDGGGGGSGAAGGSSGRGGAPRDVRMIGLQQDILRGSVGSAAASALPATASFGERLAAGAASAASDRASSAPVTGAREMSFVPSAATSPASKGGKGKGGKGRGGKGKGGKGRGSGGGGRPSMSSGEDRRGMERGMLGPAKGGGKGKGRGGKGRGGGGRGRR
jgi:ribosome biogenesis protein ENP2